MGFAAQSEDSEPAASPPMTTLRKWTEPPAEACMPSWSRGGDGEGGRGRGQIWCWSLERQMHTALNRSNPTPIPAHSATLLPLGLWRSRATFTALPGSALLAEWGGLRMCTAACTAGTGVSVMWVLRQEGRIVGFGQNRGIY